MNVINTVPKSPHILFSRHYRPPTTFPRLPKIPTKYKHRAIKEAQQALADYLHFTKSLPFTYADHISNNALRSLCNLIANLDYSASTFSKSVGRLLRYNPINEFEFFFESIGIDYSQVGSFLPVNKFFFDEDRSVLNAAFALSDFGFPWNRLGILYREENDVFRKSAVELKARLCGFKDTYGFGNVTIVGVCLAFPYVLSGQGELSEEVVALFGDLKKVFLDYDLIRYVEGNVDAWYEVCRKIRVFYDVMDSERGEVGELMGKNKNVFLDYPEEILVQKVKYFCRFGVRKENIGRLLLQIPEILNIDVETRAMSIEELLKHFGMNAEELKAVSQKYPYVFGRNKMSNLPHVMRALDRQDWFLDKIESGNHQLLANYELSEPNEVVDKEFKDFLEKIKTTRTPIHTMSKLNFLHEIGFGENSLTITVLHHLHGTSSELQDRFDCLLHNGIEFSKLCMLIRSHPKILNQKPETLKQKLRFLCEDIGASLHYLDVFPAYLCFDLENRIKPRYRFHMWLTEKGLNNSKNYSIASMVATSEKNFVARLYGIHPAAPKQWFECFSYKKP